jgi:benzoate-CoA ligase family protein
MVTPGPLRAADLPPYYNAVHILEHNLALRAGKIALLTPSRTLTFAEVSAEVNRVGNALVRLGVRFGETVGLLCLDSAEWVTSFFGIMKMGGVAVGLNTLLKPREQAYTLTDARVRVLILHRDLLPTIEPIRDELRFLEHVIVVGGMGRPGDRSFAEWIAPETDQLQAASTHREDFCSLNYSSGTTGEPKGILHAHKDYPITAQLVGVNGLGLGEADRTFGAPKLFFTFGTGGNLIFPWFVGASVVLYPGPPRVATNVLEVIDRFKPTIHYNAPTGYAAMLAVADFTSKYDLRSLRLCVSAGEALPAPIFLAWKERTGVEIVDGLGSTENFHMFIMGRPGQIRPGATGKPIEGYEVRLQDDEGRDVPQGQIGNLFVRGETAALAYLHQYAASQRTFQGEWLRTGDKYSVDEDGYFWHAGRSDDMLKVGGIWVSPVEVESTLLCHPAVLECAVIGQEDQAGLIKPKAYVVLKEGHAASADLPVALISFCRQRIADYKRPRWVELVAELPKTATGKIQRFKLRELSEARASVSRAGDHV